MAFLKRLIRALPLLVLSPFLMAISFLALFLVQLFTRRGGLLPGRTNSEPDGKTILTRRRGDAEEDAEEDAEKKQEGSGFTPSPGGGDSGERGGKKSELRSDGQAGGLSYCSAATVVIPNWNGKDLLAKYIPSVRAALAGNPANEILVVDNGSSDGSADFLRESFPDVTVLALPENLGFGGGSNAGVSAAKNEIVVLLNSDMRVAADFLAPLLEGFSDSEVFAVACQIFFTDPARLREETGLTQGWWQDGNLRVRHRIDDAVDDLFRSEVLAVACQIFFTDPARLREETGLTQGWWQDGNLRVRHRIDDAVDDLFPCFY